MSHVAEIKPTEKLRFGRLGNPVIFLGGSIDNGVCPDWQKDVVERYSKDRRKVTFLNPRRDDWNENATDGEVREQIYWELDGLEGSDAILIYFHPDSKAPISLLELGLFSRAQKVVVVCPPGYWRRTNVQVVCTRYAIQCCDDLDEGMARVIALAGYNFKAGKVLERRMREAA